MEAPPAGHSGSTEMEVDLVVLVLVLFWVLEPVADPVLEPVVEAVSVPVVEAVSVPVDVADAAVPVPEPVVAVSEAVSVPLALCVLEAVVAVSVTVSRFKMSSNIFGDDHATDARSIRLKSTLNTLNERILLV